MSEEQAVQAPLKGAGAHSAAGSGVLTTGRGGCGPRATLSELKRGALAGGGEGRAAAERGRREGRAQLPAPRLHNSSPRGRGKEGVGTRSSPWWRWRRSRGWTYSRRVSLRSAKSAGNQHPPFNWAMELCVATDCSRCPGLPASGSHGIPTPVCVDVRTTLALSSLGVTTANAGILEAGGVWHTHKPGHTSNLPCACVRACVRACACVCVKRQRQRVRWGIVLGTS